MFESKSKYDLAIIMPVLNEEKYIGQTLEQIYNQDFPMDRLEIVVADGGSVDRTREIVESWKPRFGSLKLLDNPIRKPSSGRNAGVKNSTAPRIVVVDGHVYLPSKMLLKDIVGTFDKTGADCLCRPQPLNPPGINEFEVAVALCRGSSLGHKPGSEIYDEDYEGEVDPTSSGAMWTRTAFEQVGLFDEDFDACEDVELNYRISRSGLKSYISPKLKVFYYPRSSLKGLWRQMYRYGLGRFRFARKHQVFSLMQWLAGAGVAGFVLLLVLGLMFTPVLKLFQILVAFYLLIVIFFSLGLALREKQLACLLYGPLIFPVIHFGLGAGFLSGMIETYTKTGRAAREAGL